MMMMIKNKERRWIRKFLSRSKGVEAIKDRFFYPINGKCVGLKPAIGVFLYILNFNLLLVVNKVKITDFNV